MKANVAAALKLLESIPQRAIWNTSGEHLSVTVEIFDGEEVLQRTTYSFKEHEELMAADQKERDEVTQQEHKVLWHKMHEDNTAAEVKRQKAALAEQAAMIKKQEGAKS